MIQQISYNCSFTIATRIPITSSHNTRSKRPRNCLLIKAGNLEFTVRFNSLMNQNGIQFYTIQTVPLLKKSRGPHIALDTNTLPRYSTRFQNYFTTKNKNSRHHNYIPLLIQAICKIMIYLVQVGTEVDIG